MRNLMGAVSRVESPLLLFILGHAALLDDCSTVLALESNWRIDAADDAVSALERFEVDAPSIVLANTELSLDGPDGLQVCQLLKARSASTGVILLLPHRTVERRLAAFEAQADDCLDAPFDLRELAARTNSLARRCAIPAPFQANRNPDATPAFHASLSISLTVAQLCCAPSTA